MSRYDNAVVPRKEPFIKSTLDGEGADDLIRQLVAPTGHPSEETPA